MVNDLKNLNVSDAMKAHGPTSFFVKSLVRYSLLGWGLAAFFMISLVILSGFFILAPRPIMLVNDKGQVLGEYLNSIQRSRSEYNNAGKHFVTSFNAFNSSTAYEDKQASLNLMCPKLRKIWYKKWLDLDAIPKIEEAEARNIVSVIDKKTVIDINFNNTANAYFEMKSKLTPLHPSYKGKTHDSIDYYGLELTLKPIIRTKFNTHGICVSALFEKIVDIKENEKTLN